MNDTFADIKNERRIEIRDIKMKKWFRVDWQTFQYIINVCKTFGEQDGAGGYVRNYKDVVGVSLLYLGRQTSFHDAGAKMNVSPSTAQRYVIQFVKTLSSPAVVGMFIHFPRTPAGWRLVERGFHSKVIDVHSPYNTLHFPGSIHQP